MRVGGSEPGWGDRATRPAPTRFAPQTDLPLRGRSFSEVRAADGTVDNTAGTFTVSTLDISSLTDSTTDTATLNSYISGADAAIKDMTDAAGSLGAVKSRIGIQQTFVKGLMDAIDRGVSALVDADMNEESTKLQALQVQQQLGVQALSIANASSQVILKLFQ